MVGSEECLERAERALQMAELTLEPAAKSALEQVSEEWRELAKVAAKYERGQRLRHH